MLRNNLSTRPFYNDRLVTLVLALVALVALALTAFNVTQILSLSSERRGLRTQIEADNLEAARIRGEAAALQQTIDRTRLGLLRVSTEEANRLIDQRAFSWTRFFAYVEQTMPYDVRLISVQPQVERGEFLVSMNVVARDLADVETFASNLDRTGAFRDVFVQARQRDDDGTFRAAITSGYAPPATASTAAATGDGGTTPAGEGSR